MPDAGLLIHCFDGYEGDGTAAALYAPSDGHDAVSASLIYGAQSGAGNPSAFLFSTCATRGGLVLRPGASTRVMCASAADSGGTCVAGPGEAPMATESPHGLYNGDDYPGDGCRRCRWAPPAIHGYLRRVTHWQQAHRRPFYNEFVLSAAHWKAGLPEIIEATFGPQGERAHAALVNHFGARASGVLRVRLQGESVSAPMEDT